MKKTESFKISLNELKSNKLRAGLTMLGIIFGVAAVIAMMSISEGAKQETLQQIELMGTNNIIINRVKLPDSDNKKTSFSAGLNLKDGSAISELNPNVEWITPQREMDLQVIYKANLQTVKVIGTSPDYPSTFNTRVSEGSFFNKYHLQHYSNICVIGSGIKNKFFRFEDPVNKKIKIGDLWFTIVGAAAKKSLSAGTQDLGLRDFNEDIYIPITTMMYKFEKKEQMPSFSGMVIIMSGGFGGENANVVDRNAVDQLTVKVKEGKDIKETASLVSRILDRRHYSIKDYKVVMPEQLLEQKQKTQRIFNIVMGAIAGISLLVGGIGIMNIMLANIMERTKEIGLRRAVGATRNDVLMQFMYEAVIISVSGGILGILMGFLLTSLISGYAEWKTVISPFSIVLAFMVSAATGIIFGIYPAKKAADKNPIESLRYE